MLASPLTDPGDEPAIPKPQRFLRLHPVTGDRASVEQFIQTRYRDSFGACISEFLPLLLSVHERNILLSAVGLRPGGENQFFVEHYLEGPIEAVIQSGTGQAIDRREIMETGNLAAIRGGSQLLFITLTQLLHEAGFRWVTFTATEQVQSLLHRLGFAPQTICTAHASALPGRGQTWGRYYEFSPAVVYGDVAKAWATLQKNQVARRVLDELAGNLTGLAGQLHATGTGRAR